MKSKLDINGIAAVFVLGISAVCAGGEMEVKRVTTTILTDDVDACVAFWTERLDFEQTMAVPAQQPGESGNQFAAVSNGRHELMFQTFKSTEEDLPGMYKPTDERSFMLYVEVPDLDAAIERMEGLEAAVSRRQTFYGADEIGYKDPCGVLIVLANFPEGADADSGGADAP
jgi:catechol 2,3-dioxygenase-like lactoylglutathione lyase family enzyme